MIELLGILVLLAFLLALVSLRDYKGHRQFTHIQSQLRKERIKGTIILPNDGTKVGTHYSSYSESSSSS